MFCDQAKIKFIAGRGGDGAKSFRREKFVPYGGPDGGDGGKGGDVFLIADSNLYTLYDLNHKKLYIAPDGKRGGSQRKTGQNGQDIYIKVPCGTMIFDFPKQNILADLTDHGNTFLVAKGGKGGKGNSHFATSSLKAPKFAELGQPGQEIEIILELKLIADCGIIGLPSVGKSTLISIISSARPKIAPYPFTTLVPNLGVVKMNKHSFVVADIPGLIEGASEGKGLGYNFLRHISRSAILLHLLDASHPNLLNEYKIVNQELEKYDPSLLSKETIIAINKIDLLSKTKLEKIKQLFAFQNKADLLLISALTKQNIHELIKRLAQKINLSKKKSKIYAEAEPTFKLFKPHLKKEISECEIEMKYHKEGNTENKIFTIKYPRLERIAQMTDFSNEQAVSRVYYLMDRWNVTRKLLKLGAIPGNLIEIKSHTIEFLG